MENQKAIFKADLGKLWIKADVVQRTETKFLLSCGGKQFWIGKDNVKLLKETV